MNFPVLVDHWVKLKESEKRDKYPDLACRIVDFAVPADHKVELKDAEKRGKYLDLARELKNPWNIKVMVIAIAFCELSVVKIGQNTKKSQGDLLSFKLHWKNIS